MILDPCCGSRMMWFNPEHQGVLFGDIRRVLETTAKYWNVEYNQDSNGGYNNEQ